MIRTVGVIEAAYHKKHNQNGEAIELSPSDLIDCSEHNSGCEGGYPALGFDHVLSKGIAKESDVEYYPQKGECDNSLERPINISSYNRLDDNECALMKHLNSTGPVSALICAPKELKNYKSGVFDEIDCLGKCGVVNHAVLVVGYGTDNQYGDYWLVKNSWGEEWGEKVIKTNPKIGIMTIQPI